MFSASSTITNSENSSKQQISESAVAAEPPTELIDDSKLNLTSNTEVVTPVSMDVDDDQDSIITANSGLDQVKLGFGDIKSETQRPEDNNMTLSEDFAIEAGVNSTVSTEEQLSEGTEQVDVTNKSKQEVKKAENVTSEESFAEQKVAVEQNGDITTLG